MIWRATEAGSYYILVQSGTCTAVSDARQVTKPGNAGSIAKPVLDIHPDNAQYCIGGNVYMSVTNLNAYTNPTFSWFKDGVALGVTTSYYITRVNGEYFVVVEDGNCTSSSENINVQQGTGTIATPQMDIYPASQEICGEFGTVVMRLRNASSYLNATYQWYKDGIAIRNANKIMYSAEEEGTYYLQIITSDGCGVVCDPIEITKNNAVIAEIDLEVFPEDAIMRNNDPIEMTVLNGNDYTGAMYYWFKGTDIVSSGINKVRYDAAEIGDYRLLIVDGNSCAVWSQEVNVRDSDCPEYVPEPVIVVTPLANGDQYDLCLPEGSVFFRVSNKDDYDAPAYQWYKNNSPIAGATSFYLEVVNNANLGAGIYRLSITDKGCIVYSRSYNVVNSTGTMPVKPLISAHPTGAAICGNDGAVILRLTNPEEFTGATYQWYKDNEPIAGAGSIIYEATAPGQYRLFVGEGNCSAISGQISVVPGTGNIEKPRLNKNPNQDEICNNGSIRLEVANASSYGNVTYYWYKNTEIVQDGPSPYYFATTAGTYFVQVVDGNTCSAVSEKETLRTSGSTITAPEITTYPSTNMICGEDGVVVLRLTTTYPAGATYQWYRNNMPVAGANSVTYSATEAGDYHLEVISQSCGASSTPVTIQKQNGSSISLPLVTLDPEEMIENDPVALTFANINAYTQPLYHWFTNEKTTLLQSNVLTYEATVTGTYYLLVEDNGCARWSNDIDVREASCVLAKPELNVIPAQNRICGTNGSALIQVSNRNVYANPTYQWYRNNVAIGGNTPTIEVTQDGTYHVKVSDADCYNYSLTETIVRVSSEIAKPFVERIPNGDICGSEGSVILSFINVQEYTSPRYQWYKDNYAITNATELIYVVTEPGKYRVVVEDNGCMAMSAEEDVRRVSGNITQPEISRSPDSYDICINGSIRLDVSNKSDYASNAVYVWYKGDRQVQRSSLTSGFVATEAGQYMVQVIENSCAAVSETTTLNSGGGYINTPVIATYPADPANGNKIVCGENGVVVLRLSNTYAPGTTYQWYKDGIAIAQATGIIYSATETGSYYVEVKNFECAAVSDPVSVVKSSSSFIPKPDLSIDPEDGRIVEGLSAVLQLENPNVYPGRYCYWFKGDLNRFESTASVIRQGVNELSYTTDEIGDYRLLIVDGTCASWSDLKQVTIDGMCHIADPVVTAVYDITNVCGANGSVLLQVSNRDQYITPAYQWYKDNSPIGGQTRSTLELSAQDDGLYQVAITDGCRKVSNPAIPITTNNNATIKPLVARTPVNGNLCGASGSVILTFTNAQEFQGATYQWFKDNYEIPNANGRIYEVTQPGRYRVVVRDGNCLAMSVEENVISQSGTIRKPLVSKTPDRNTICTNGSIRLSVTNTNEYPSSAGYVWYKDDLRVGDGTDFVATEQGTYFVQVIDGTCSATSRREVLTPSGTTIVVPDVVSYPESINKTICGDYGVVVFRLNNAIQYTGASFQWYRNDEPMANENDIVLSVSEAGTYYLQIISGDCGVISTPITVIKNPGSGSIADPNISMFPTDGEIPSGGSVTLSFNNSAAYSSGVKYYWFRGTSEIVAENTLTYAATQTGRYRLLVVDHDCARWSSRELDVTTGCDAEKPILTVVPSGSSVVCTPNGAILLQVSNRQVYLNPSYEWYDGNTIIPGQTGAALEVTAAGNYRVRVSEAGCKNYSDVQSIGTSNVPGLERPLVSRIPSGGICGNDGSVILRFTNAADFTGATYQWYKDNFAIPNATEEIYEVTQAGKYRIVVIDGGCMVMSAEEDIRTNTSYSIDKPLVSKSPDKTEICVNGSIRLTVTNTSSYDQATYIWYRGSEEVQRSAVPSYVATAGGRYFVQVIDGNTCSATSERIPLTMGSSSISTPEITVYPESNDVCANNGVAVIRLTNSASYTGAAYQWYKNGMPISGETGTVLSVTQAGDYYIEVATIDCYAVSRTVTIRRNSSCTIDPPRIAATPSDAMIVGGNPVVLTLQNPGSYTSPQYYWFKDGETVVQQGTDFTYSATVPGFYKLLVVETGKAAWSNEIEVKESVCPTATPLLSVEPQSLDICGVNGSVYMSLLNIGDFTSGARFEWRRNNVVIANSNFPYYNATEAGLYELRVYDRVNSESCLGVSQSYQVTKTPASFIEPLDIRMTPSSGILCNDGSVILYVYNRGAYEDATYRWYKNGLLIQGATGNTYEVKYENQAETRATYTAQVIEGGCGAVSVDELIVNKSNNTAIKPIVAASGTKVCGEHGSVLLMFSNESDFGSGTKFYQWFYNNELIAGATSPTYEAELGGDYRLQVVAGSCGAFSDVVSLIGSGDEIPKPKVETSPVNGLICGTQGSVMLYLTNVDEYNNPTYQWYKNNMPIQGATGSSYEAFERASYRIQVSENECSALSVPRAVNTSATEIEKPLVEVRPDAAEICGENGVITLRLTNPEVYQNGIYIWYRNDIMIPDATHAIYHATEAGAYRIQVVDDRCAAFSRTIDLRKNNSYIAKPELVLTPANGYLCGEGSVVTLSVNNASQYNNATYVWYNANGIVQEGTSSIFETSVEGDYYVQVIDGTCSSLSITKEVRITTGNFNRPEIASTSGGYNVCGANGVVIMQLTNAGDYTQPVYQWYRNDIAIAGAVTEIYQATEAGSYTLRVTDGDCSAYSLSRNVTKDNSSITKPVIARNPDTEYICGEYGSILLSVANSSSYRNATYIWFKGTTIVQNSAVPTYEAETEGTYYVQVSESGCSSVSETVQLRTSSAVFAKPVIASSSGEYVICGDDGVVTLRLTNPGDYTNPSYQWYKNGIAITGATDIIYHATSEGEYKIQVLDGLCGGFSVGKNVTRENTYIEKPRLSLSPASGIITDGESVTITVTNHSVYTNPSYIWYMGTQIVEQNGTSTYQANVAGTYYVEVVDGNCSSISDPEELRRSGLATPQVSSQPASNTICGVNGVVVLRLENADVYYNPIFQWYRNDVVIPGATAIVYHATQAGNYRIQVETPFDEIYSEQIVITQNGGDIDRPELISIPESALLCGDGGNVEFQVSNASDYTNPTYIWYHGTDVVQNGPLSTYLASTTGVYYVQVVESGCSSVSTSVNVRNSGNNIARARISAIPQSNNICGNNGVVILRLDNEDDYANASYQWYRNDVAIAGANTVLYQATTAGSYSIRVEDGDCLTYSSSINVTKDNGFIERPTLDLSPATGIISEGGSVLLTVNNHSVYTNPTYIWYRGTEILQNNPSFTYNATVAGVYYVQVVEGGCSAVSEPEVLRQSGVVVPTPLITSLPESNTICGNNGVVILRVTNPGDYQNPEFQWLKDGIRIPGATTTVYHAREEGNYQVQVIDVGGAANSRTINIRKDADSYIPQPLLAKNPVSGYLCGDFGSVFLSVTNKAEFNNATYVWYHGNEIVQNGPRSTFEAHATGEYYVQVIEGDCSSVSTSEFVRPSSTTINEPYIIATPDSRNICGENGVVVLRMTNAEDYPNATYQWYRYNEPVQGETSTMLVTTIAGEYRIHVMQDHCAAFSLPINVTKDNSFIAKPLLAKTPDSGYICGENGSVLIYVTNTDQYSNPTYIWYTGTQIIQRGYVPSIEVISEEDYYVQVIDGGCSSLSDPERAIPSASFIAEPNVVSIPDNNVICGNNGVVLLKLTNEDEYVNAVYQWFKDSIAIPGANSIIYHATEAGEYRLIVVDEVCAAFSVNITVRKENGNIARPQVVKAPESGNICGANGSVMLSVSNHQQYVNPVYHWYRGTQLVQEELFPTYEALVAGEYYVQVVDEGCASVSARTTVRSSSSQINEVVVSATPSSQNICGNNGVVILTVENEASYSNPTYQWYRNNVLVPNTNDEIYHATTAGEYRVQVIEEPCAAVSAPLTITRDNSFIPKPLVNTSSDNNVICAPGSHVTLTVTNNQDYTNAQYIWYNNSEVVQRGTDHNYDATVAGTYYVQVVEGGCSSVSLVEVITVNTDPMPTANISGDITILQGSSADITIDLTGTAPWLVEFTNGVSVTVYNTPYVFTIYPMSDTTITLSRVTDAVGCPNKVEGSVTIRVYEKPTLIIDEIHKVCITDAQIYIDYERVVDLPLNYTLRFSPEAIAVGFQNRVTPLLLPDNEITVRMPANVIQGDYDVDLTISYGAYTITYPIVIRVVPTLAIAQQPVSSDALCTDFDLNLSVDAVGEDLTYQWYFNGNPIPGARASTYTATFAPDMAGSYHVIVNSFCGGPLSSQIVSIQEKNLQISMKWDDVIFVKNTNERYRSYQWYLNGEPIRTDGTNQYYHNPRGLNGEYTVRAYYENGSYDESCPVSVSSGRNMRVMVYPNPVEANQQISVLIETGYDEAVDAKIELYDITGRILLNTVTRQTITELPVRVAPGTYVVRITTHDAQVFVHKIIVK